MTGASEDAPTQPISRGLLDRASAVLVLGAAAAFVYLRATAPLPHDLATYLAGAQTFWAGANPYSAALVDAPSYSGYPYLYAPGTLYLWVPLTRLPTPVVAVGHALAQLAAIAWIGLRLRDRYELAIPPWTTVAALALFGPVIVDLLVGNLAVLALAGVLTVGWLADRPSPPGARRVTAVALLGLALALKPPWLIPAVLLCVAARRPRLIGALCVGPLAVGALSAAHPQWLGDWWGQLAGLGTFFERRGQGLLSGSTLLWALATLAWLGVSAAAVRRHLRGPATARTADAVVMAGWVSALVWPRLELYGFVAFLPPLAALGRDLGLGWAVGLLAVLWGPIYWWLTETPALYALQLSWAGLIVAATAYRWTRRRPSPQTSSG